LCVLCLAVVVPFSVDPMPCANTINSRILNIVIVCWAMRVMLWSAAKVNLCPVMCNSIAVSMLAVSPQRTLPIMNANVMLATMV
ncbi:hypothetical protein DOY81_015435, partial [Sarcophaga bullata]